MRFVAVFGECVNPAIALDEPNFDLTRTSGLAASRREIDKLFTGVLHFEVMALCCRPVAQFAARTSGILKGKREFKRRSFAELTCDPDLPAMRLYDLFDDRES